MTHAVWFRTDLRTHSHPALYAASLADQGVIAFFVATPETWIYHEAAPVKLDFIFRNLQALQQALAPFNISLLQLECPKYEDTTELLIDFCIKNKITQLYFNEQYEIDEQRRDAEVEAQLRAHGIGVQRFHDQLLIPPGQILSHKNEPLRMFTPFKKKWLACMKDTLLAEESNLPHKQSTNPTLDAPTIKNPYASPLQALWPAGEQAALAKWADFSAHHIQDYHIQRDFPAAPGTSMLSPYLAQGVISVKDLFRQLQHLEDSPGKDMWINELIWREFYKNLIYLIPKLCCSVSLQAKFKHWPWEQNETLFNAWQAGLTGFPLIDAAMRQLKATGWMHNRLRMNVAMFLSKLLNVEWRWGESHFMRHLIDGDLAANNGGWQWAAGTGCDAAPYFRIFNPLKQSETFDPQGDFIRQYCPELRDFDDYAIHAPHERAPLLAQQSGYPTPIIDYATARKAACARRLI